MITSRPRRPAAQGRAGAPTRRPQALPTGRPGGAPNAGYFFGRCASALPAAVFDALPVRPSRSTLLAAAAADFPVTLPLPMPSPSSVSPTGGRRTALRSPDRTAGDGATSVVGVRAREGGREGRGGGREG